MSQEDTKYLFKLYVAGMTRDRRDDISRIEQMMMKVVDDFTLEVIDVLENPSLAEENHVLATPTIVKELPEPVTKIIIDLENLDSIKAGLNSILNIK